MSATLCLFVVYALRLFALSLSYSSVIYAGLKLTLLKVNGSVK